MILLLKGGCEGITYVLQKYNNTPYGVIGQHTNNTRTYFHQIKNKTNPYEYTLVMNTASEISPLSFDLVVGQVFPTKYSGRMLWHVQ